MCDVVVVVLFLFLEIHILLFVNFRSHDKFKNSDLNFAIVYLTIYFRGCHVHIPIAVPRILPSFNCIIIDGCECSHNTTTVSGKPISNFHQQIHTCVCKTFYGSSIPGVSVCITELLRP